MVASGPAIKELDDGARERTCLAGGDTRSPDVLCNALGFRSRACAGWLWCDGDGGASAVTGAEALASNAL